MPGPLLATKLYIPKVRRRQHVSRVRLIQRLARVAESRLTLVSAPAGFGKTTLLADWIATHQAEATGIAWLSLDEQDNDVSGFWAYVIAALQKAAPRIAGGATARLQSAQPPAVEDLLATLINELGSITTDLVLVLDDYHVVSLPEIHEGMAFLLDHLPPSVHLVLASRADPPLPLARLRARGDLLEVRAADLRFEAEETAAYLNGAMDLGLSTPDLDALEGRTEGWIAALQLAALSMQGRDDISGFIEEFAGDNRYIVDYLAQEVLQRQPAGVRDFLLNTAILDRMTGALCDAVTGQTDGKAVLQSLEQGNVFVVPLDDRREWFRYHHLFKDVLRAHLLDEEPGRVRDLHRRAGSWFEEHGYRPEAIRHLLAAGDFERAADLVEWAMPEMLKARQEVALRAWLEALPDEVVRARPVLAVGYVGVLMHSGDISTVEARLLDAERVLDGNAVIVDEEQYLELPGMIALYRAGYAQVTGNLTATVTHARLALERMPTGHPLRGGAMALLGLALWSNGDLEAAYQTYADGIALVHAGGYVNDSSALMLADMRVSQGRLRDALAIYQRALERATAQGNAAPRGIADLRAGISELYREQNELDVAEHHLLLSRELGENAGLPEMRYRWFTAMAAVRQAEGDVPAALDLLQQAERLYSPGFSPDIRPIHALRARLWLTQGRLAEALRWVQEHDLSVDDDLSYLREFEHLTLTRVLILQSGQSVAREPIRDAGRLLDRLLEAAEAGHRTGAVIEALGLKAIVEGATGDSATSLAHLERAIALAEPEGYVRVFVDEGTVVEALLRQLSGRTDSRYVRRLLAAFQPGSTASPAAADSETLSERELEVMRLLSTDLSGPDIANQLVVSLNTMRTHTKSIYAKLGVNSRRAAVRRAEELHLL